MAFKRAAIDLGAGSGRIFAGTPDSFQEICRFPNTWNFDETMESIRKGLALLKDDPPVSVSCDSWAQDFGLADGENRVCYQPVSYLTNRAAAIPEKIADILTGSEIFRLTAESHLSSITTICQWLYMVREEPEAFKHAAALLPVSDLVNMLLGGKAVLNFSLASVGHMLKPLSTDPNTELFDRLGLNKKLILPVSGPAVIGTWEGIPVISGIGHDTAAAFYGSGACENELFISLGSWAMMGTCWSGKLSPEHESFPMGILPGQFSRFLSRNGMRILNACVAHWKKCGEFPGFAEFDRQVATSPFTGTFDPEKVDLSAPDILKEIASLCTAEPRTMADFGKAIAQSVAESLADGARLLEREAGLRFKRVIVSGGGTMDPNLRAAMERDFDAEVVFGEREMTVRGNLLIQEHLTQSIPN